MLRRSAELDPLVWAVQYREIRGERFVVPPPLVDIYREQAKEVVVAKAAQVGASEWAVNLALWAADSRAGGRGIALYVFPAIAQLGDFVRARIDTAVEESSYLLGRVRPVRGLEPMGRSTDNVGLKRVGRGFIYFRGSNAKAGLLTVDADIVLYDEVDRLTEGTLALGAERLGSSLLGWQRYTSTPVYPETGIDALWLKSDRRRWHVTCPACNAEQAPTFPDNLREDGQLVCVACHGPLPPAWQAGRWLPENPGAEVRGYHVSKFLSPRADLAKLAKTGYRILARDETDPSKVQEFWNQGCGVPHAPEGGQLSRAELSACLADYSLGDWTPTGCTMGVDVGGKYHCRINAPGPGGKARAAFIGSVPGWSDLDALMSRFDVSCCVVDAEPEHHGALQFQQRWPDRVWLCHYGAGSAWQHQDVAVWNEVEGTVFAHRTMTLDATFARIRERRIELPREALDLPEYAEQMMAPVRIVEKDGRGNPVARYVEGGRADHLAHSEGYAWVAESKPGPAIEETVIYNDPVMISDYERRW